MIWTIVITIVVAVAAAAATRWVDRRRRTERPVVLHLVDGTSLQSDRAVRRRFRWVLRDVTIPGSTPVEVAGDVEVRRERVSWVQLLAP